MTSCRSTSVQHRHAPLAVCTATPPATGVPGGRWNGTESVGRMFTLRNAMVTAGDDEDL
jgi:hypothetical protein